MRFYQTVPAHVEERPRDAGMACDRCGTRSDTDGQWPGADGWNHDEVTIEARIGGIYPEGDFRTGYVADVCPPCFVNHVLPALLAAGVTVTEFHSDEGVPARERPA